jgi:hypothetical protein
MRGLVPPWRRLPRETWQLVSSPASPPVLLQESSLPSLPVLLQESSLPSLPVLSQESSLPSPLLSHESLSSVEAAPHAAQLSAAAPQESSVDVVGGGCVVGGG